MAYVTEYKCPNCSAPLSFDPTSGDVTCGHCGKSFPVESIVESQVGHADSEEFDWGNYQASLNNDTIQDTVMYQCQSCGAVIETDASTAATKCPYCDNNVVLTDRVSGGLKPNAVIPFKIDKSQIPALLENFYKGKKLLPRNFFSERVMEKAQGVYVPFWLFDGTVAGSAGYDATRVRVYRQGKYEVTETSRYYLERAGRVAFRNVPVDASTKLDNDLMDSLEPFDYSAVVPFDAQYLAGFVADRFDSDPDREIVRANERMVNTTRSFFDSTTMGYTSVTPRNRSIGLQSPQVRYALLPVYILNCQYGGKSYRYAINGQTGKVVGDLPSSRGKLLGYMAAVFAGIMALVTVFGNTFL